MWNGKMAAVSGYTFPEDLLKRILQFKETCRDLIEIPSVPSLNSPPTALEFYRDFVSQNKPVVIRNAIGHWPALAKWDFQYILSTMGDQRVAVSITPNGYADAVCGDLFVTPFEMDMLFSDFLSVLRDQRPAHCPEGVYYIQQQNSNFTLDQYSGLRKDTKDSISWATQAFNAQPEAVNFWMGDKQAVTSMHKDHYENIYCVVKGRKKFILHPPTDRPFIPHGMYRQAKYEVNKETKKLFIQEKAGDKDPIPWVCIDPLQPDLDSHPLYRHAHKLEVTVEEGETLYLPSLWFHHVQQEHGTIAINYWYDMEFGMNYCYYQLLSDLVS